MTFKTDPALFPKAFHKVYKENIDTLIKLLPEVFNKEFPLPLATGVHKQIRDLTKWKPWKLHAVMAIWTSRMEYTLMACSQGLRYDLNGNVFSAISEENRQYYVIKLNTYRNMERIKQFCVDYNKAFGHPALLCVPIKSRPDLGDFK